MQRTDSFEKTLMFGRSKVGREGDDRGWDGWMASPTRWTWDWVSSGSWWWTRRPGVLQSMGSQKVRHDWATELNWIFSWAINTVLSPDAGQQVGATAPSQPSVRRGNDQYTYNHSVSRQPTILLFTSVQCPMNYTKCSTPSYKTGFVLPHYRLT